MTAQFAGHIEAESPAEAFGKFTQVLLQIGADPGDIVAGLGAVLVRTMAETTPVEHLDEGIEILIHCIQRHAQAIKDERRKGAH